MTKEILVSFYSKYQLIIFPILVAISSIILIVLMIYPQITRLLTNEQSLREIRHNLQFLEVKAQDLESLDEVDLTTRVSVSLAALPADKDFVQAVGAIQQLVQRSGFELISLQLGSSKESSGVLGFAIKIEISGPKITLGQLLTSIETSQRVMKVSSIEVTATRSGDLINASLTIDVFYSPVPSTIGAINAPLPKLTSEEEELIITLSSAIPSAPAPPTTFVPQPRGKANPFE